LDIIQEDPVDNRVLEAALSGGAGAIISGDHHLLRLGRYAGIDIVTAQAFCAAHGL
ncbi:MAG: DNA-binding protein, partial [Clostridia bacterium]|nr:DNA-binding protein [Clostridia bacterium]